MKKPLFYLSFLLIGSLSYSQSNTNFPVNLKSGTQFYPNNILEFISSKKKEKTVQNRYYKFVQFNSIPSQTSKEQMIESDSFFTFSCKFHIILNHLFLSKGKKLGKLFDSVSKRSLSNTAFDVENTSKSNPFLFQRQKFRPNYETNTVFILSVLQSAISALVSHKGYPFYHGILESRDFCRWLCITFLFVIVCITGSMPSLISFLDIKPLPSKRSKLVFLGISMINIIACVLCRRIMDQLLPTVRFPSRNNKLTIYSDLTKKSEEFKKNAADRE